MFQCRGDSCRFQEYPRHEVYNTRLILKSKQKQHLKLTTMYCKTSVLIFLLLAAVVASKNVIPYPPIGGQVCGSNAFWSNCASPCTTTCSNYNNIRNICPTVCTFGCVCDQGYVMHDVIGKCVLISECNKN